MYRYPVDACDVRDKGELERFRQKRTQWIAELHGPDRHSIWNQINLMLADDVLFRTINDLRGLSTTAPHPGVGFNGPVAALFDAGFVATQVTAIRRLTDSRPRDPTRGVISLRSLIQDLRQHRALLTRELCVAYDGLPYDYEPVRQEWLAQHLERMGSGIAVWDETYGPHAWMSAMRVHENFDRLSGCTSPDARLPDDQIKEAWFDALEVRLDDCQDIRKFADKFIAHAADPVSRDGLTPAQTGVTLDRLRRCHRALYDVAAFLFGPLLWEGATSAVPMPQGDHLEHLEKGWVAADAQDASREIWDRHFSALEAWEQPTWWPQLTTDGA